MLLGAPGNLQYLKQYGFKTFEDANYHWTEVSKQTPHIKNFVESLPYEYLKRVRIMKLKAGDKLPSAELFYLDHNNDLNYLFQKFHFPLKVFEIDAFQ